MYLYTSIYTHTYNSLIEKIKQGIYLLIKCLKITEVIWWEKLGNCNQNSKPHSHMESSRRQLKRGHMGAM